MHAPRACASPSLTFKEGVGSVGDAAPVGSILETPLCKLRRRKLFLLTTGDSTW